VVVVGGVVDDRCVGYRRRGEIDNKYLSNFKVGLVGGRGVVWPGGECGLVGSGRVVMWWPGLGRRWSEKWELKWELEEEEWELGRRWRSFDGEWGGRP
jgi:hypothetical protein